MVEASINWSTHALTVSTGPKKVNNDGTETDQWDPSIAANPSGTELFVGYYSRQNDPVTNSWIMAYGAKAYITNGLAKATFECFPISSTSFQPLFAGTSAIPSNPLTYDPVWPAPGICLDANAVFNGLHTPGVFCPPGIDSPEPDGTHGDYSNFCADDYTWSAADGVYFYFSWCDRTRVFQNTRADADIKFARIKQ